MLKLHNTLTGTKDEFVPLDPNRVTLYVCGPTVYNYVHIGNARPVVVFEVLYRLLSGMHAATNTHIARHYHAPSRRHNRTEWGPNLEYFGAQFAANPERLKNLHFAFVVLLRAVRRAGRYDERRYDDERRDERR